MKIEIYFTFFLILILEHYKTIKIYRLDVHIHKRQYFVWTIACTYTNQKINLPPVIES